MHVPPKRAKQLTNVVKIALGIQGMGSNDDFA